MPRPDFYHYTLPAGQLYVLTDDGAGTAGELSRLLAEKGEKSVILQFPSGIVPLRSELSADVPVIKLSELSDEYLKTVFDEIRTKYGEIASFIHLHPHFSFPAGQFARHFEAERKIIKTVFFSAKHLSKAIKATGEKTVRASWLTVSRLDGKFGTENPGTTSVFGGGLSGLTKTLNLEWSSVFCRHSDISPDFSATEAAEKVFAELHCADYSLIETGVTPEGRWSLKAKPADSPAGEQKPTSISSKSVFLVSGGGKGITAGCAIRLAETYGCGFILLGRSAYIGQDPAWAEGLEKEPDMKRAVMQDFIKNGKKPTPKDINRAVGKVVADREIGQTLRSLETLGSRAIYLPADVNDAASVQKAVQKGESVVGKVTGLIHGAGVLADKYIENKTEWDFDLVFSVKIGGLLNLLRAANPDTLEHCVFFSSVAGFYGNFGQSDYAVANEILSKAAWLMRKNHPKCHTVAVNWGAWDSGMVSPALKKTFEEHGVSLVPADGGVNAMMNELTTDRAAKSQVILGGTLPAGERFVTEPQTHRIGRKLLLSENPFLHHHSIGGNPVLPIVNAAAWPARSAADLYPEFRLAEVRDVKLYKGIVFDGNEAQDYDLELIETAKSAEEIVLAAKISSPTDKLPRFHYACEIVLQKKPAAAPLISDIPTETGGESGADLYTSKTLFHGPHFQGIDKILKVTENEILMACSATEVPLEEQGQFSVKQTNGFLNDILYQALVVWVRKNKDAYSLPLKTRQVKIYAPIPFGRKFFVRVNVEKSDDFSARADIRVFDETGTVFTETLGAEVTVSKDLVWA